MHIPTTLTIILLTIVASAVMLPGRRGRDQWFLKRQYPLADSWFSGAVWDYGFGPNTFISVQGTFTLTAPTSPDGRVSVLVGIDIMQCDTSAFVAGVDYDVTNGNPGYVVWYGWWPNIYTVNTIPLNVGDQIAISLTAATSIDGVVSIQNLNNGKSILQSVLSTHPLCLGDVEWIVERSDGAQAPFCNFGGIHFTNTLAALINGTSLTAVGAEQWIAQTPSGTNITGVRVDEVGDVFINYII